MSDLCWSRGLECPRVDIHRSIHLPFAMIPLNLNMKEDAFVEEQAPHIQSIAAGLSAEIASPSRTVLRLLAQC